jgi:hypothetical protein
VLPRVLVRNSYYSLGYEKKDANKFPYGATAAMAFTLF